MCCRSSIAVELLRGLTSYRLTPTPVEAAKADKSQKHALRLTKQKTAKARRQEAEIGDAEAVSAVTISPRQIESTPFFQYLDTMVGISYDAVCPDEMHTAHFDHDLMYSKTDLTDACVVSGGDAACRCGKLCPWQAAPDVSVTS